MENKKNPINFRDVPHRLEQFHTPDVRLFFQSFCNDFCSDGEDIVHSPLKEVTKAVLKELIFAIPVDLTKEAITVQFLLDLFDNVGAKLKNRARRLSPIWKRLLIKVVREQFYSSADNVLPKLARHCAKLEKIANITPFIVTFLRNNIDMDYVEYWEMQVGEEESIWTVQLDTPDPDVHDFLYTFALSIKENSQVRPGRKPFYEHFAASLGFCIPPNLNGYSVDTLILQAHYYRQLSMDKLLHNRLMMELRLFYLYLDDLTNGSILNIQTGVSRAYLLRDSFFDDYDAGYRLVRPNIYDPVPEIDKWMISPDGKQSVSHEGLYGSVCPLDFSVVTDTQLRSALKAWFWNELVIGLPQKIKHVEYVISFLKQRDALRSRYFHTFLATRSNQYIEVEDTILAEEVYECTREWQDTLKKSAFKSKIQPVQKFLTYLMEYNLYRVEPVVFSYLTSRGHKQEETNIPPISDDECKILEERLRVKRRDNLQSDLRYLIFCLLILTPLRILSILRLEADCIVQKSHNNYALQINHKTGYGDKREVQISMYVFRLVEYALSITEDVRTAAPQEMKKFLFLCQGKKGVYAPISLVSFHQYLENACDEVGIPHYSAQNLRKSYMTRVVTESIKQNINLTSIAALTSHKSFRTTREKYVRPDIREYLEAIHGVIISDSPVRGTCVQKYDDTGGTESVVEDGRGYCRNSECNILGTASCLMCSSFITTPEQLPYFEDAVKIIDAQIQQCDNPHDRKHLSMIKALMIKYIAVLLGIAEEEE